MDYVYSSASVCSLRNSCEKCKLRNTIKVKEIELELDSRI